MTCTEKPRWSRAIKNRRITLHMSQEQFADYIGVSRWSIINWEGGAKPAKSCRQLLKEKANIGDWAYESY